MGIPQKREDFTITWFNTIFNVKGIKVHDMAFTGEIGHGKGFMGTLEQVDLKISKYKADETTTIHAPNRTETLSIILKTLPKDPIRRAYAANDGFSSRELSMYTDVFPIWDKFMDDRQIPLTSRFKYPVCYYGAEEGEGESYKYILVLENLTAPQSDFKLWTSGFTEPLPWIKASPIIQQIARFHATGIAYRMESHVEYYKLFPKLKHFLGQPFCEMWDKGFTIAKEVIKSVMDKKDIPNGLFKQLEKLCGNASRERLLKWFTDPTMISTLGSTATICHHDLHSQNLVLSKDHSHAILFDYQVCCVFNPMKDLTFFLILNCETEDITLNLQRALQLYHDEFEQTMKAFNIDFKYPMEEIMNDYNRYFAFSLTHIITGAPIWITGSKSSTASKRRFAVAVIDAFKKDILKFPDPAIF